MEVEVNKDMEVKKEEKRSREMLYPAVSAEFWFATHPPSGLPFGPNAV